MITSNLTDDEKRKVLMNMTYEDLEAEIISGRLTWQEFDRLLPEIGAAIGAKVMFEESVNKKDATKPIRPPVYGMPETAAPHQPLQKPLEYEPPSGPPSYSPTRKLGRPTDSPDDSDIAKLRRAVERMAKAQDKTNDLLADILKELKRR
jgi:hypothetical protein